ncbi:MAG: hypothetical protein ACI9W4_002832, partial [Rhodothermales bacterium]
MSTSLRKLSALALLLACALPSAGQSGSFGNAVVLTDGELIIGEPNTTFREGSVYVYTKASGGWDLTDRLVAPDAERADGFGSVLA